jgi:mannose-6-phosphate isomerase-like protein (cupin superfamily)
MRAKECDVPSYPYHINVEKAPRETRYGGTYQRTGFIMDQALVSFVWLDGYVRAENRPQHVHDCDQMVYILSGRMEMVLHMETDISYTLETGDVIYIPGKVPHTGKLFDNQPCYLMELFAPIRADYLYFTQHQQEVGQAPRHEDGSRNNPRSDGSRVIDGVVVPY